MLQPTCSLALVQHVDEALLSCCWPRWACGFCNAACGVQLRLLADRLEWTLSEAKQDLVKLQSQVRQPPHSQARRRSAPPRTSGPHSAAQLGRKTCLHMGWVSTEQLKCQVCQSDLRPKIAHQRVLDRLAGSPCAPKPYRGCTLSRHFSPTCMVCIARLRPTSCAVESAVQFV